MIIANLYVNQSIPIGEIIGALQTLPDDLKPLYFSPGERIVKKNKISMTEKFSKFVSETKYGFFLCSDNGDKFSVSNNTFGHSEITLWINDDRPCELAFSFIKALMPLKPVFGFACEWAEYIHRNRFFKKIGSNNIESWVGRNFQKYIPGLYWITVLSNQILRCHDVEFQSIYSAGEKDKSYSSGDTHVICLFGRPEEWIEHSDELDQMCGASEGIFSISEVNAEVYNVENYEQYSNILKEWR